MSFLPCHPINRAPLLTSPQYQLFFQPLSGKLTAIMVVGVEFTVIYLRSYGVDSDSVDMIVPNFQPRSSAPHHPWFSNGPFGDLGLPMDHACSARAKQPRHPHGKKFPASARGNHTQSRRTMCFNHGATLTLVVYTPFLYLDMLYHGRSKRSLPCKVDSRGSLFI